MTTEQDAILDDSFHAMDFGSGIRQDDGLLSVRWPGGVCLKLQKNWAYHLMIVRDGYIFRHQILQKNDAQLLLWVERFAKDISDGKYKTKKTEKERILEILSKRNLTSCMNNTKWRELRTAMLDELPFAPPYDFKTLFDGSDYILGEHVRHLIHNEGPNSFCSLDAESFYFLNYKAIEWFKVRPRFFTETGGQLVKQKVWYDCEKAFVEILKKYAIAHEAENGVYTIYGYK